MAWAQLFCEVSHDKYVTLELNCKAMKQFTYLSIHVDPKQYTSSIDEQISEDMYTLWKLWTKRGTNWINIIQEKKLFSGEWHMYL